MFCFDRDFASQLINEGKRSNLIIENNAPTIFLDDHPRNTRFKFDLKSKFDELRRDGFELVVVVISGRNKQVYGTF